ncbi:hypothetical protein GJ744_003760 [Endocarpon pusillum]|uniref:C2H2-type domain-containing protein n=1 Tax=Endocarpon pusillum TaxID=364733 RepID=A0A8H7A6A1_9EURO|nr:hypothetical protein GJ744_003760 [Endocarpon pusillum]
MSQVQGIRLSIPGCAESASSAASVSLDSSDGSPAASAAFRNEPQELLGLSSGPRPMSITTSPIPRTLSNSASSGQQPYTIDISPDYSFPEELGLNDPKGAQPVWPGYQVTGNDNDNVAYPPRRLTPAEPEQPWSGIHLNAPLPSQLRGDDGQRGSTAPMNARIGQQRSIVGSHANETESGYYTYSQHDMRSIRSGPSSVPRSIPLVQGHSTFAQYNADQSFTAMDYQFRGPMEPQLSSQVQREPHRCTEPGCEFTFKTISELKKHTARHRREHVCNQPGCTRANKGFPTINDLERHQKSVHGMEPLHGQSRMYKCFALNCKNREKEWPRLDNFKQHLQRMHKGLSTEELIRQSNEWYDTEKKPHQPASLVAGATPSRGSHFSNSGPDLMSETSSLAKSQNHLSLAWRPTRNALRQQQSTTPNRPRHSSLSSQPSSSASLSPTRKSSSVPFPGLGMNLGNYQLGQTPMAIIPTPLSSDLLLDHSQRPTRGRPTAHTVPNPDTSALSDLSDISYSTPSGSFHIPQDDLAHIAPNLNAEAQSAFQSAFLSADQTLCSPSTPANRGTGSSSSPLSIEAITDFINSSTGGQKAESAFILRIIEAGLSKLREAGPQSNPATTTSSSSSVITSTLTSHPDSTNTRLQHSCPEKPCTKTYHRRCDLKKHLKRHHRPYGCTFSKCYEKFGSKYDWKRHENTQHFQNECWKCALCSSGTGRNGHASTSSFPAQLFYRRNIFMAHMQKVHQLSSEATREHAHKQRIGRGCQTRFWCGFCKRIVELQKKGLEGADERFNHIDKHFKQKCDISDWVVVEGSEAKGQQDEVDREEEQEEQEEQEEDIDDVLGSDGIGDSPTTVGEEIDDGRSRENYDYDVNDGGGGANARNDIGQKRTIPSDFEGSSRPSQQRRTHPTHGRTTPYAFRCCQCREGPHTLMLGRHCPMCSHVCCAFCPYMDDKGLDVGRSR